METPSARSVIPEQRWTFSNVLSASRFVLAIPLCWSLWYGATWWILFWALLSAATDFFDGYVARRLRQVSDFGKILDPIADKVMVGSAALTIYLSGRVEWWLFAVIIVRDLLILLGGIFVQRRYAVVLSSNQVGKWAVGFVSLSLMLCAMNLGPHDLWIGISMVSLVVSFAVYCWTFLTFLRKA